MIYCLLFIVSGLLLAVKFEVTSGCVTVPRDSPTTEGT